MLFFDEGKQRKGCEVLLPLWTSVNDAPFPTEKTSKIARNLPKYLRYSRQKMNTLNKKSRKTPNKKSSFKKKNTSSPKKKATVLFLEKRSKSTTSIHRIQGPLPPFGDFFRFRSFASKGYVTNGTKPGEAITAAEKAMGMGCLLVGFGWRFGR